jgi:protein-tyrosine-phosphatase
MKKIVFIDRGNILRSPMARVIYNSLGSRDCIAYAYGTNVKQEGNDGLILSEYLPLQETIEVLQSHGMDISKERCIQLLPEHLDGVSKIIVMTEKEDIPEWLKKHTYEYWEIPNPEVVTKEVAEDIFNLLKSKILLLKES